MGSMNIPSSGNAARNPSENYPVFYQRTLSTEPTSTSTAHSSEPRLVHDLSQTLSNLYQEAFGPNDSQQAHLQREQMADLPLIYGHSESRLAAQEADDFLSRFAPNA